MTTEIRENVNGYELLFWGGHEFSQGSPFVYELSVNGQGFGGEHFDPRPFAYRDSFLVARRAHGLGQFGFAIYWFDPQRHEFRRVSKVKPYLSVRSVGEGYVEAAHRAYGNGDVRRVELGNVTKQPMTSGQKLGLALMVVAGGWLIADSIQPQNASFPSTVNIGESLLPALAFVLGAAIFARDTYFKWREDRRAERAAERDEERFNRENAD